MPDNTEDITNRYSKALFCNWPIKSDKFEQTDLFELHELTNYDVMFFDPLHFVVYNRLRHDNSDIRMAEYMPYSEIDFRHFLSRIKSVTDQIRGFIDSGGIWVIRSNLPNSYIKVRKKSRAGSSGYTESVISVFFWLEEFLGKYSFQYINESHIRFLDDMNPLCRILKGKPVQCLQTQNKISIGNVEIIGDLGTQIQLPVASKISFARDKGEIYLIPRFLDKNEPIMLVGAFGDIIQKRNIQPYKPEWAVEYEKQIDFVDPYSNILAQIEKDMAKLEQTRNDTKAKQAEIHACSGLLYKTGSELVKLVESTFRLLGFYFPEPPPAISKSGLDLYIRDKLAKHVVILVCSSIEGPIDHLHYNRLTQIVDSFTMKKELKVILVGNAFHNIPPGQRPDCFDSEIVEENKQRGFCFLSTFQLFEITCNVLRRSDSSGTESVKMSLRKDIIESDGLFEINQNKYCVGS